MNKKIKVVFLVELPKGTSRQCRAICLACTRILMCLSKFPKKEHQNQLQWGYKLFSPEAPMAPSLITTAQFYELHSENLMKLYEDLSKSREEGPSSMKKGWERCVYNALAATVQEFIWDAPEIRTPIRSKSRQRRIKLSGKNSQLDDSLSKNLIFLFSGLSDEVSKSASLVLPRPLMIQLCQKGISLNWVYTTNLGNTDLSGSLSQVLHTTGGSLVPISTFLAPVWLHRDMISLPSSIHPVTNVKACLTAGDGMRESAKEEFLWLCSKGWSISELCVKQPKQCAWSLNISDFPRFLLAVA